MSHQPAPSELFHDPIDDMSFVPDLSTVQAEVVEVLELNPEHRAHPRLTRHELDRVDAVIAWAESRPTIPRPRPAI